MNSTRNSNADSQDKSSDQITRVSVLSAGAGLAPAPTPGSGIVTASNGDHPPQTPQQAPQMSQYSVFSKRKKRYVVLAASIGAVFSTLTAQTYLPALKVLADDFHVSVSKINLTVTTYLIFQGITPMFIGSFADRLGRRPAYIICFVVYIAANIGLAVSPNYASLLAIRCLQAAGISGTQSLCQAVVADIITSAERGQYIGFVTLSAILGPSLGPLIGGALTDGLGWRSIFWFLTICAGINLVLMVLFFPETCRPIVGDGSIRPPKTHETLWQLIKGHHWRDSSGSQPPILPSTAVEGQATKSTFGVKHLFTSLALLWAKELGLLLAYGGLLYSGINAISAALPTQFTEIYGFNSLEIGLMFLPMAAGSVIAVAVVGKAINWNYRRHAKKLGLTVDKSRQIDLADFPIERARLEVALPLLYVTAAVMVAWGWALESRTSVAVPCVLAFILGVVYIGVLNAFNTLITDLYRKKAGAAVAANWFVRCMMGAVMTAVIQPLILAVGSGWAYTIMGLSYVLFSPSLLLIMRKGMVWRKEEREKEEQRMAEKEEERIGEKGERTDNARDDEEGVQGTG
jgi:multidrug resistance protein